MSTLHSLLILVTCTTANSGLPNPLADDVITETIMQWDFDHGTEGWVAEKQCRLLADDGLLKIETTGDDPYMHCPVDVAGGALRLIVRARCESAGGGAVYWTTHNSPRGEDKTSHFALKHDNQWREYETQFGVTGQLTDLRIDPGTAAGRIEIDWVRLVRETPHPIQLSHAMTLDQQVLFDVKNRGTEQVRFSCDGMQYQLAPQEAMVLSQRMVKAAPLEAIQIELRGDGLPAIGRHLFVYHPDVQSDWIERELAGSTLRIARDGTVARWESQGQLVALIGPLVHCDGKMPALEVVAEQPDVRLQGDGITVTLSAQGQEVTIGIESQQPCTGPVVRAQGVLEQGLLAGVEYLGRGERSSSPLDIETSDRFRFTPDPLKVTMPLMAFVTDLGSVAMTWNDMQLQPQFATPNRFDYDQDHRLALQGKRIEATLRLSHDPLEEAILWATRKKTLPPLPDAPRTLAEQWQICIQALNGPLKTDAGWGHCAEPRWARHPYSDMASTIWRLAGQIADLPRLVPGGAHVRNDSIYFVSGRAHEWLGHQKRKMENLLDRQQPDGSFHYNGRYRRGHFEDTASGVNARPASELLEYARLTGDPKALEAGLRTLKYMRRFRTPRGAQVWELSMHTPDQLASAYLVWAYVRGYELTGDPTFLVDARKWALSGIPFVYLWQKYPIMLYATPPVYGATNWRAPLWIGLPVQWVGGVYAYALTLLAPYDDTLDWNHLARGILVTAEQMQYPDGDYVGLLPDAFQLSGQQRVPARINPCALVSLRLALEGQLDSLAVAIDGDDRIVAPFPVSIDAGKARIQAKPGVTYQVLINGERIVDIASDGVDIVQLR